LRYSAVLHSNYGHRLSALKKDRFWVSERGRLNMRKGDEIPVGSERAGETEMDELWSLIGKKKGRGGCGAIDHLTGSSLPMSWASPG
jgi:hypothetical protein